MKKYYIGIGICNYIAVHIIEDGYKQTVMVHEDNLYGFIQCLEHFGFTQ